MSLSRPGVARVAATGRATLRAFVALIAALAGLTGCNGALVNGYYLLPAAREAYIADDFEWREDGRWDFGAEEGYPDALDVRGGYFIAGEPRQFARTWEPLPTTLEVVAGWEVWSPDVTPIRDNGDAFDFRIMLDTSDTEGYAPSGIRVELKLLDGGIEDRLTITDDASGDSATVTGGPFGATRGTFGVTFRRGVDASSVVAAVRDRTGVPILETELALAERWERNAHLMVAASAYNDGSLVEARAYDAVYALRPEEL